MVPHKRCTIFREGKKKPNLHMQELLKSGSNDKCRESFRQRICEVGPVWKSRFKTVKEEDQVEGSEFADALRKAELLDHENCMWLSSGGALSPSSCYEGNGVSGYMDLKIDAWFISLLLTPSPRSAPFLSTEVTFFDGSRVNPIEEASLVLDQRTFPDEDVIFQENLKEDEVVSWLVTSIDNELPDTSSATCSDGDAESSRGQSSVQGFNDFHGFSLLHSKWISDKRSELAYLQPEFATRVCKSYQLSASSVSSVTDSSDEHSMFSSSSSSDYSSEVVDLEEICINEPLFWPSDCASEWASQAKWDFFVMSPCKDIDSIHNSPKASPETLTPRFSNGEFDSINRCNRKLVFGADSKSSASLDLKSINGINEVRKMRSIPSRLKKSTKIEVITETKGVPKNESSDTFSATCCKGAESSCGQSSFQGFSNSRSFTCKRSEPTCTQSDSATPVHKSLQLFAPSVSSATNATDEGSLFSSSSSSDHASEVIDLEETSTKTPVFWPSGCGFEWGSESKWDFFVISPRKYPYKAAKSPKTSPDTLRSVVSNRNIDLEKGCSRRLEFSTGSKSSTNIGEVGKTRSMPSRLKSTKRVDTRDEDDTNEQAEVEVLTEDSAGKHKVLLEDLLLVEKLNAEAAIEKVLGLEEFDGHEGVESEFNKDDFSLGDIL